MEKIRQTIRLQQSLLNILQRYIDHYKLDKHILFECMVAAECYPKEKAISVINNIFPEYMDLTYQSTIYFYRDKEYTKTNFNIDPILLEDFKERAKLTGDSLNQLAQYVIGLDVLTEMCHRTVRLTNSLFYYDLLWIPEPPYPPIPRIKSNDNRETKNPEYDRYTKSRTQLWRWMHGEPEILWDYSVSTGLVPRFVAKG